MKITVSLCDKALRMKDESIKIRVSEAEKAAFERAAEISGIGVSAWARVALRKAATKQLRTNEETPAFLSQSKTAYNEKSE